jgi:hypothetical protein
MAERWDSASRIPQVNRSSSLVDRNSVFNDIEGFAEKLKQAATKNTL